MPHAVTVRHCIFDVCDWWLGVEKECCVKHYWAQATSIFSLGELVVLFLVSMAPLMILPQTAPITLRKFSYIEH